MNKHNLPEKYPKKLYQKKMRAYLDALREQLDEIEAQLERKNIVLDTNELNRLISRARASNAKAHAELHRIEARDGIWESLRSGLENAFNELMAVLDYVENHVVQENDERSERDTQ